MLERTGLLKFRSMDVTILGSDLKIGDKAPDFIVQAQDWNSIQGLEATRGKVRIIASVPSLETDVCDRETRKFNQEAATLSKDIAILVISMDLPYTQKKWCGAAGVEQVTVLSDHLLGDFGVKYACLIKEVRILRRAIFVVDRDGFIKYSAYMPVLGEEPDYADVLAVAKSALS